MTSLATDSFTGSDYAELDTYSANWTQIGTNRAGIYSNSFTGWDGAVGAGYLWNAVTFPNDQYAKTTLVAQLATEGNASGPGVRMNSSNGGNGYYCLCDYGGTYVGSCSNGSFSDLFSSSQTDISETAELRISSTTLSLYIAGVYQTGTTDSTHSSGAAGVFTYGADNRTRSDDFDAGDLTTALSINKTDAVTLGESTSIGAITRSLSVTDEITIGETSSVSAGSPPTIVISSLDNTVVGDSSSVLLSTSTINISEGITVGESSSVTFPPGVTLTISVTDDVGAYDPPFSGSVTQSVSVTEGVTVGETTSAVFQNALVVNVNDPSSIGEAVLQALNALAMQVSDDTIVADNSNVSVSESPPGPTLSINVAPDNIMYWVRGVKVS